MDKNDLECAQASPKDERLTERPLSTNRESDKAGGVPFQVEPYSSEYAAGVDPKKLKELLNELDVELLIRKIAG